MPSTRTETKRRVRLSKAAVRDLLEIGAFTKERWGDQRCSEYLAALDRRFQTIAARPEAGTRCDELRLGYWFAREGRHVVFYRIRKRRAGVDVIRVLHQRMLPERHL